MFDPGMPRRISGLQIVLLVSSTALIASGCQSPGLMATPNLYERGYVNPFNEVPQPLQTSEVRVLYATDRAPIPSESGETTYGSMRSHSAAFGWAQVEFGEDVPWDVLRQNSLQMKRTIDLEPRVTDVREIRRLSPSNERLEVVDDQVRVRQAVIDEDNQLKAEVHQLLLDALEQTDRNEVYVFIHGYNVDFNGAILTIAQIWHFLGRTGVPVSYTWPAGHGGVRGYTADRESGEFTIFHLKQFLRAVASCPEVERMNIIAHSRGTDVALTALRELHIECRGAGLDTRKELKLENLVLAAPDLDFEVVTQRVGAEGLMLVPKRMVVYISPEDKAIGVSSWLFDSVRRIGRLRLSDLSAYQRKQVVEVPSIEVVDARAKKADFFGHSYFYHSPAVSSDLILILREDRSAGPESGRPLDREEGSFWILNNDYPMFPNPPAPSK